ncbi:MAG: hypothetical protein WEC59_11565 [Salibacteraceae bacterium]
MKQFIILPVLFLFPFLIIAQTNEIEIVFYNVENLFDTIDQVNVNDEEFTPNGKKEYDSFKYYKKLENLSKVINARSIEAEMDLLGLCEVENSEVVLALAKRLKNSNDFELVHFDSPDQRGIDNALLYNVNQFELKDAGLEPIDLGYSERPTRGILWVVLAEKHTGQLFLVFVNHWPSRYGGAEESNWKRMRASETLVELIQKLRNQIPEAIEIVMGDLNDYPYNESTLNLERCDDQNAPCLVNMHKHFVDEGEGTYVFRGEWGVLDHILVSRSLLQADHIMWKAEANSGSTISHDWMMYEDKKSGELFPSRSFGGSHYYGGFSDHLPVHLTLRLKKAE